MSTCRWASLANHWYIWVSFFVVATCVDAIHTPFTRFDTSLRVRVCVSVEMSAASGCCLSLKYTTTPTNSANANTTTNTTAREQAAATRYLFFSSNACWWLNSTPTTTTTLTQTLMDSGRMRHGSGYCWCVCVCMLCVVFVRVRVTVYWNSPPVLVWGERRHINALWIVMR